VTRSAKPAPISPEEFSERIHRYTPRTWATPLLVGLNVAVFLAMVIGGASPLNPTVPDIVKWGANVGPLSLGGEPWRLFTSMFVHIGLLHIGMNLYVLWYIGRFVEKLLGNIGMLIVYVLAGLSGSLASAAIHPAVVSAGASGAIFGLYGAVFGYLIRNRDQVPTETLRSLRRLAGIFVVGNIGIGYLIPAIDVSAHIGGLAGGFVFGFLISGALTDAGVARRPWRNLITAGMGLAALALVEHGLPTPVDFEAELRRVAALDDQTVDRYKAADAQLNQRRISGPELARTIQTEIRPPWNAAQLRLEGLRLSGHDALVRQKLVEYMAARDRFFDLTVHYLTDPQIASLAAIQAQRKEYTRLEQEVGALLRSTPKP